VPMRLFVLFLLAGLDLKSKRNARHFVSPGQTLLRIGRIPEYCESAAEIMRS
jgi:hypothetical protein